jgi:hypothetical protein
VIVPGISAGAPPDEFNQCNLVSSEPIVAIAGIASPPVFMGRRWQRLQAVKS